MYRTRFIRPLWMVAALACLVMMAAPAYAGPGLDRLNAFYREMRSMRADFDQQVRDSSGAKIQEASGTLFLQRPGKFRWEYRRPYEQLVLSDGRKIWLYDGELEQVTVKRADAALAGTPALLLSGAGSLLDQFAITELGEKNGLQWLQLEPRNKDAGFSQVRLAFQGAEPRVMEMEDGLGQVTRLAFSKVQRNPGLSASLFAFTPPKGVDVIGDVD